MSRQASNAFSGNGIPMELHISLGNGVNGRGRNARKPGRPLPPPTLLLAKAKNGMFAFHVPAALRPSVACRPG